jgi:hypothetical protein
LKKAVRKAAVRKVRRKKAKDTNELPSIFTM